MSTQFAQISDFYNFIGEELPDLTDAEELALNAKLMRASRSISRAIRTAFIQWDTTTGFPTNTVVAGGLRDATCAQAAWFTDNGDDMSGAGSGFSHVAMAGVVLARNVSSAGAVSASDSRHAPEVADILAALPIWSTKVGRSY